MSGARREREIDNTPLDMGDADVARPAQHRAAKRALELIEIVADGDGGLTLSELAVRAGVPKSTAHALLHTLTEETFLERSPSEGRYTIGPRLLRLLGRVPDQFELPRIARPIMQQIVDEFGETALLGIRRGAHILYVEQVEAPQFIRYVVPLGEPRPLHCTSIGKLFMAYMEPADLRSLLRESPPQSYTAHTETDIDGLLRQARSVRAEGVGYNREESIAGATAVAAPIFAGGKPQAPMIAGISLVGPSQRVRPHLDEGRTLVLAAAERIALATLR